MTEIKISKLVCSKRRTMVLEITREAELIVRVPNKISASAIERFIREKSDWIICKQKAIREKYQAIVPKQFTQGEKFLYLGEHYNLMLVDNIKKSLHFEQGFYLSEKYLDKAKNLFIKWYKTQAYQTISERVDCYAKSNNLKYQKIKITSAKTRWASCSYQGNLNFSWRLIMAPLPVVDYVVAHELAHLQHKNHSQRFWNKVKEIFPDYEKCRKWLRNNGHLLTF